MEVAERREEIVIKCNDSGNIVDRDNDTERSKTLLPMTSCNKITHYVP